MSQLGHQTIAAALRQDPRVIEARRLLHAALADHQAALESVRPADVERIECYGKALEQFAHYRGSNLYFPYLGSGIGRGALVELDDGSVKYDMIGGIGVHYFGHSHRRLIDAALDAALADTVMQGNLQQNTESAELAAALLALATGSGGNLEHCFLTTSGAMANENALKLAFCRRHPADRVLAFSGGFCGRTLALAQVTDKAAYRTGLPTTLAVDYVPFFNTEAPERSTTMALRALHAHFQRYPGRHAAMIIELILGEGGYYPGQREFFVALMQLLHEHEVTVIVDEIQSFGRTTEPFAFSHFGLQSLVDVVTVGKMSQVCATLFDADHRPPPGLVSQTFTASTSAILAAKQICAMMQEPGLFGPDGRIARLSARFVDRLQAIESRHPDWISGPYGFGAMIAFTPLDGSPETAKRLVHALFDAGVIGFVAGSNPARVRFLPPMPVLQEYEVDRVSELLEESLQHVAEGANV